MNSELKYHRLFLRISNLEIRMKRLILFNYILTALLAIALYVVATKASSVESGRAARKEIYYINQYFPDALDSIFQATKN